MQIAVCKVEKKMLSRSLISAGNHAQIRCSRIEWRVLQLMAFDDKFLHIFMAHCYQSDALNALQPKKIYLFLMPHENK